MNPRLLPLWRIATRLCGLGAGLLVAMLTPARAQPPGLPAPILQALSDARIAPQALSLWAASTQSREPLLSWQAERPVQVASLMKLLTSAAALEQLGPTFQWSTGILLERQPVDGVLSGSVYLQGRGDPRLTPERLQLLLQQLQQMGVQDIRGDIVLDRSAYRLPAHDPGAFDGEPFKPYNVQPAALMVNQHSLMLNFRPVPGRHVARVTATPALSGVRPSAELRLVNGPCGDWRSTVGADFSAADRLEFRGRYPADCGERSWPVAYVDPASYTARAIDAQWRAQGGRLSGRVREGTAPAEVLAASRGDPLLSGSFASPLLPDVLRDMNKFSNNVIAQQVLLALSPSLPASFETARPQALRLLQQDGVACASDEYRLDNGSGLSRDERLSARCLGRLLHWAWGRPWMPELVSSLPVAGTEATARRLNGAAGRAHLKTGSLNNVSGMAGYVDQPGGERTVLVAVLNDHGADSDAARTVLNAILRWSTALYSPADPTWKDPP